MSSLLCISCVVCIRCRRRQNPNYPRVGETTSPEFIKGTQVSKSLVVGLAIKPRISFFDSRQVRN